MKQKQIIVIGGGAAGFFAAVNVAERTPGAKISILEKSNKLLSKVKVSGGGRCNVTHNCLDNGELIKNYPRGQKELRQVFSRFSVIDTVEWFKKRGVELKTESDGRMFPVSDNSETIIDCFLGEAKKFNVSVNLQEEVLEIEKQSNGQLHVITSVSNYMADAVICSTGGHNKIQNYDFIKKAGHNITKLIPSLFTINIPDTDIKELMGLSVKNATVKVNGTKHQYSGPILITHWGLSGPAVLKLSAFAAIDFFERNYSSDITVNWTGSLNDEQVKHVLESNINSKAFVVNVPLFDFPKRLWEYFISKAGIPLQKPWNETGKKQLNKLAQIVSADVFKMKGKTTFKDEFVTSGGVDLKEIDFKTMESKIVPNLFFCGEVLNIDGITGGFNFQSAWSTAWVAASSIK